MATIVMENDPALRIIRVLVDPDSPPEHRAAFAEYIAHDVPDFESWADETLLNAPGLYPCRVIMVDSVGELHQALPGADGLIKEDLAFGAAELACAPRLRLVQHYGGRAYNVDTEACLARGIAVLTQRRRTNIAVAEHALTMLMALSKRLTEIDGMVTMARLRSSGFCPGAFSTGYTANANWPRIPGLRTLSGQTLGVIGLGEIGSELARMATGIGMRVVYHQRNRASVAVERASGAAYTRLDDLLKISDSVSMHVPKHVVNLIDARAFSLMKPGAFLVNTARAPSVDRTAMLAALNSGRIGGVALDVLYDEPMHDNDELLKLSNVLLTPHLAGGSRLNGLTDVREMIVRISNELRTDRN